MVKATRRESIQGLDSIVINGRKVFFRPDTNDISLVKEVIVFGRRCYQRSRSGFMIEPGEIWLDLGGSIGVFAVLCEELGA